MIEGHLKPLRQDIAALKAWRTFLAGGAAVIGLQVSVLGILVAAHTAHLI